MMPTLTIAQAKEFFFDRAAVLAAIDQGRAAALGRGAAYVGRVARNSIKDGRKYARRRRGAPMEEPREVTGYVPSEPGRPPRSRTGLLRSTILHYLDPSTETAVVGPVIIGRPTGAPANLEFGGTAVVGRRGRRRRVRIEARPYMAPALEKSLPRIPEQFRDIVGGPVR